MTIAIKPTATTATIEHNDSTILTVDSSGNITPSNDLYPKVPVFSAYASSSQTPTAGTWTKIEFDTEEFDTNSNYNTTNYRFTPTVGGYYQVNISMKVEGITNRMIVGLHKNGSLYKIGDDLQGTYGRNVTGSFMVQLNGSTDYIEAYMFDGGGGSNAISLAHQTHFFWWISERIMFGISAFSQAPFSSLAGAILNGQATITANANVSADFVRVRNSTASITITGNADAGTSANAIMHGVGAITGTASITVTLSGSDVFGNASITGNTTVTSDGVRIRTSDASINGQATITVALSGSIIDASADITGNATITTEGLRIRLGDASVTGSASASALGGIEVDGNATVNSLATIQCAGVGTFSGNATMTSNGTLVVTGYLLGEEWSDAEVGTETWADASTGSESWTVVTSGSETWTDSTVGTESWTDQATGTDDWKRKG